MSDAARLLGWFDAGELVRPDDAAPSLLHLSVAMATLCGVDGIASTRHADRIAETIGPADHYVFVLVDGMGMHLVDELAADDPLRVHLAMELRTVFPSSTAPALTTLATALPPSQHAVPGWWTYVPDAGATATILPFVERFSERPLAVDPRVAFPAGVMAARYRRRCFWVSPKPIAGSVSSRYFSADAPHYGYESLTRAIEAIDRRIAEADTPTYTYFYIPFVDTAEHEHGPESAQVRLTLAQVRRRLRLLFDTVRGRARVIVTADHGQVTVQTAGRHILDRNDALLAMLRHAPSCEPRASAFHVRDGACEQFAAAFRARFGEAFALIAIDEADELRLFGATPLSAETRRRLGDFVAMPRGLDVILYEPSRELRAMKGFHGGLTRDEMRVPLILA